MFKNFVVEKEFFKNAEFLITNLRAFHLRLGIEFGLR